jgi:hypothetical protein
VSEEEEEEEEVQGIKRLSQCKISHQRKRKRGQ